MKKLIQLLAVVLVIASCRNPMDRLQVNVQPTLMNYVATIDITDMTTKKGLTGDVKISFSGKDGKYIYSTDGTKKFVLQDGKISISLHPDREPASITDTVKFNLEVSANGYIPATVQVNFIKDQFVHNVRTRLMNINNPPPGLSVKETNLSLSNGKLTTPTIAKGKGTADSVYYDDGQTSVVLPEGTTFYYWGWDWAEGVRTVPVWEEKTHIETVNGEPHEVTTRILGYYEEQKYKYRAYVKKKYTGGAIKLYTWYTNSSYNYRISGSDGYYVSPSAPIRLYDGSSVTQDEILYKSAVTKKLYVLNFIGSITENGVERQIELSPDAASKWFVSYELDPTIINPVTGQTIKEGDSIEVSIDFENGITRREEIKKANGKLRAQTQNLDAGYYYKANYVYNLNYQINTTYDDNQLPDPENIYAEIYTPLFWTYIDTYSPQIAFSGKIASANAVAPSGSIYVYYWGKRVKEMAINSFSYSASPFQGLSLGSLSSWDFTIQCGERAYQPTYTGSASYSSNAQSGYFNARVVAGKWKTRGLTLGQNYTFNGMGYTPKGKLISVTRTYPVNAVNYIVDFLDGGGAFICDEF